MKRLTTLLLAVLAVSMVWAQGIPFIRNFPATEYGGHNQNFDIITDEGGMVYVANFEGLLYYDNADWNILHTPGINRITSLFRDSQNVIWTGGYNYIGYVKHDQQGRPFLHSIHIRDAFNGEVKWIWENDGHIFFLCSDEQIYTIRNDKVIQASSATVPHSGKSTFIGSAHINQSQQLEDGFRALATEGSGVIFTNASGQELFRVTEENGLCSNNVSYITYNGHGLIWGATDNGLFCIAFPSIYTHFTPREGLSGEVLSLEYLNGQLYAGTLNGLFIKNGNIFQPIPELSHACWQFAKTSGALMVATADGIFRIEGRHNIRKLTTAASYSVFPVENGFYSGENNGVFFYDYKGGRRKVCDADKVLKIYSDKNGDIWLQNLYGSLWKSVGGKSIEPIYLDNSQHEAPATLVKYRDKLFPVTAQAQKPFPYPQFSYSDGDVLWLTNNKGKKTYAWNGNGKDEVLSAFVYPLMDYSVRAITHQVNLLWLGGDKGINVVDLGGNKPLDFKMPTLHLRSILLRGDSVLWGGFGPVPEKLPKLSDDNRHLVFNYSIDYPSLLLKTQYRTRLDGKTWSAWDFETYDDFANLPYGSHFFEVQARDAFGRTTNIARIEFTIDYPFYLRWYMLLFYLILLVLFVLGIIRLRLHRLNKEKRMLELVVRERTAEVVKQKDEIEEKSKKLETALQELGEAQHELVRQEKMATVGKLTQGLIDRILNPLNYINNFAKLSERLVDDAVANIHDEEAHMDKSNYEDTMDVLGMLKGNLKKVSEHGANTTRTLKSMEEMLKDRSGGMSRINLTNIIRQDEKVVRNLFGSEIDDCHASLSFDLPDDEVFVNGNGEQLSKVLISLLGNGIYAVHKQAARMQEKNESYKPAVRLTVHQNDKFVEIAIHDNGIGIEQTIMEKIFDPFFTTKTTSEASGVGLYLAREIAQNHGGDIKAESAKGQYTIFTITLPTL